MASEKMKSLNAPHTLLICQKSKILDWKEHYEKYYSQYQVVIYDKQQFVPDNSVVIINYDLVWRRPELLNLENFTLILDESSYIKNESAKRSKFILKLKPLNVILLSGTPISGKYEELWSQCKLLGWKIPKWLFWDHFIVTKSINVGGFPIKVVEGYKNVDILKRKLREFGSVFMKTEEVFDLPEQQDITIKVSKIAEYKKFEKNKIITIDGVEMVGNNALTELLYLRQLAGHYNKYKVEAVKELIESTENRIIIFYNFKAEFEVLKGLTTKPISYVNGSGNDLSNYENKENSVTLLQYQSGSMGLNLQKANIIIYFTLPLSSELFQQSKKRVHRIGQNKTCFYYFPLVEGSIELKILEALRQRMDYTDKLFKEQYYDRKTVPR